MDNKNKTYSMDFTFEELVILIGGVGLTHKESAKNFYESLEGLKEKKDELSIDEFDKIHKTLMGLYNKLEVKIKQIAKEEK